MAMRDEKAAELVGVLLDITYVRDHQVDAQHLLFGKHEAAIDRDHVLAELEEQHVAADLSETAEGDYAQGMAIWH
jgi:hypothetical protein